MKLKTTCLLAMVLFLSMASCSKDESIETTEQELNYSIDLTLANETDWEVANGILQLINDYRASIGLEKLQKDQQYASAYAVEHTYYMIDEDHISHDHFGERSQALKDRGAKVVGENVAYGYKDAESVVEAWLNSPSHKAIIEGDYTHSGFGVLQNNKGQYFFTQLFYKK